VGTAQHILRASSAAYARAGLPAAAREFLSGANAAPTAAERAWLEHPHHHIVPFTDPHYPALLRTAQRHPLALYVAGNPRY
jgi:DNA processing protein